MSDVSVLVCKRPYLDVNPIDAAEDLSILSNCQDCSAEIYAMKKNLGKGLILLCGPCAIDRMKEESLKGEIVAILPGQIIGTEEEKRALAYVKEIEKKFKEKSENL